MKKFIYTLIFLLLLVSSVILVRSNKTVSYKADTSTKDKMINTTVLLDRSNKKKEEKEAEEKAKEEAEKEAKAKEEARQKEIARLEKIEEEKRKAAAKTTQVVRETEVVGSRASGLITDNNVNQKEESVTPQIETPKEIKVVANSEKRVFDGAKFYDRLMSSYGTDCCRANNYTDEEKERGLAVLGLGLTASGYQFKYKDIWFNAGSYGNVRMVAADHAGQIDFPLGTIVKITEKMDDGSYQSMNAIVIDRGDNNIGLDPKENGRKRRIFDLVSENMLAAESFGVHNQIDVEVLHTGTKEDLYNIRHYGRLVG